MRLHGTPWIAMVHHLVTEASEDPPGVRRLKGFIQDFSLRRIASRATRVLTYATPAGDAVANRLRLLGSGATQIDRVHNGFDQEVLSIAPDMANASDVVLVGGLRPGKGLGEIVPIWRGVVDVLPAARLRIIGGMSSENQRRLEQEIADAGLTSSILLTGAKTHDAAIAIVKAARLLISVSLQEGWGIAVCEALACGTPVVAYDLPAYQALFNGGWLAVSTGDRVAFSAAVIRALGDDELLADLSRAGKLAVSEYEWSVVAERDLEMFSTAAYAPIRR